MPVSRNGRNFSKKWEFVDVVSNYYYVDKSLLIKEVIDNEAGNDAILITRPRRFGKSLAISMLQTFFEKTEDDNSVYFKDLEIWKYGEKYTSEQGKYPVIYLDFKECESDTFEKEPWKSSKILWRPNLHGTGSLRRVRRSTGCMI